MSLVAIEHIVSEAESSFHELDDSSSTSHQEILSKAKKWRKPLVLGVLLALIATAIVFRGPIGTLITSFQDWVRENPIEGALVYILVYMVATVLAIPGLVLTIGAGVVFGGAFGMGLGIVVGSLVVFIGAMLGAIIAFTLGRTLLREYVEGWAKDFKLFKALEKVLSEKGLKTVLLLRLSPLIPFNAFNYIMGISSVPLMDYSLGSVGLLPGTIAFVSVGATAGELSETNVSSNLPIVILTVVGTVLAVIAVLYISVLARREIERLEEEMEDNQANNGMELEEYGQKQNQVVSRDQNMC